MIAKKSLIIAALVVQQLGFASEEPPRTSPTPTPKSGSSMVNREAQEHELRERADKRYEEMLEKMQAAVEEIAQLYGNPIFLQVFTNDLDRAAELKKRLRSTRSEEQIQRELTDLVKQRDDVLNDIALREKEVSRLAARLVRQRAALDDLAVAVEQARKAVEETAK